jgi:hypothetical protein
MPNPQTQTSQRDRSRSAPNDLPYRQNVNAQTPVPQTNEAASRQPPLREPTRTMSDGPELRSTPYSILRPQNSIESPSPSFGAQNPLTDASPQQNHSNLAPNDALGHRRAVSQPVPANQQAEPVLNSGMTASEFLCDGCRNPVPLSHPRVHCLECDDYDLCNDCFQAGKISKLHKPNHNIRHIIRSFCLRQADQELVPPGSIVHPQTSPGRAQPNWSIEQDVRWHHLLKFNNHTRFLASSIEPGHYVITFFIEFRFSPKVVQSHLDQLGESGFGNLRLAAGTINTKQQFFKERFLEDESLVGKLLKDGFYDDYILSSGGLGGIELNYMFSIESRPNVKAELGFVMQWSNVRSFVGSDEPFADMSLIEVRYVLPGFSLAFFL